MKWICDVRKTQEHMERLTRDRTKKSNWVSIETKKRKKEID